MQGKAGLKNQTDFRADYCSDIFLPDMLYGALVRSPKKCGQIRSITLPVLPAGYAYFCAKDIAGKNSITVNGVSIPVFAETTVNYEGEPIGIITGQDEVTVCALRDQVEVYIEEQQPVFFSAQAGLDYIAERSAVFGDPSGVSRELPVYKNSFLMQQKSMLDETFAVIASCGVKTIIYAGLHLPAALRTAISSVLNIPKDEILVQKTLSNKETLNGTLILALLACQAGTASAKLRKPVKLVISRYEQTAFCTNTSVPVIRHRTSVTKDGTLVCMNISIYVDAGVYSPHIQTALDRMVIAACGIYTPQNVCNEAFAVRTNNPPADFSLDYADYQVFFAVEAQMRHIAWDLGINPAVIRKKNMFPKLQQISTFFYLHDAQNLEQVIDTTVSVCDFSRKQTAFSLIVKQRDSSFLIPLRGIGLAAAFNGSGSFNTPDLKNKITVEALLEENGKLSLFMPEPVSAVKNSIFPIIRETLNINAHNVLFVCESSDAAKTAEFFALNAGITIQLIEKICLSIKEMRAEHPLPIRVKKKFASGNKHLWNTETFSGKPYVSTAWGSAVAEIEIDRSVFEVVLRGIWLVIDAGIIRSEKNAAAIIRRSIDRIVDALGVKTDSNLQTAVRFIPSENEFKEFASIADNIVPAAVFNAVSQAVGQTITAVPLDAKTIYAALTVQRGDE